MNITLYRKYRPQNFDEIAGQEFVTRAIKNSLRDDKLSHAYLFTGPRGVGKTTIARLIAKGVNCLNNGISDNPCGVCDNCIEITKGISMDMIEIDAASNRGIDEIRELKEKINYQPVKGRKKIYIIDEVHMLTKEAFNALLKTLEEPPSHIIFILATTEIDKIPDTVISRCQRYDFMPIEKNNIKELLKNVAIKENVNIDDESLDLIYRKSEGSARDSFSIFEQVISNFNGEEINIEKTRKALGIVSNVILEQFLQLVKEENKEKLIKFMDKLWEDGIIIETFLKDFCYYLREEFKNGNSEISIDFMLNTISKIYFILDEFKFEEDKRLLGYVLIYELYKNNNVVVKEIIKEEKRVTPVIEKKVENSTNITETIDKNLKTTDISVVKNKWKDILNEIKEKDLVLSILIQYCMPEKIENNILILKYSKEGKFSSEEIMTTTRKKKIEKIINKICDSTLEIKAICEVSEENTVNEYINKVINFFDGTVIEKR